MCFISVLSPVFLIKKKIIGFYSCSYRKLGEDWKNEDSALDEVKALPMQQADIDEKRKSTLYKLRCSRKWLGKTSH